MVAVGGLQAGEGEGGVAQEQLRLGEEHEGGGVEGEEGGEGGGATPCTLYVPRKNS